MTEPISNCARFAARPLAGGGTPVEIWTRSDRRFTPLNIDDCPALLLVAAHPDDETLGLGATASALAERGISVQVVAVTDGEAAYPEDAGGRTELAETRRDETLAAAAQPSAWRDRSSSASPTARSPPTRTGCRSSWQAILAESPPGTWCAATWRGDGHPDHEATGRAAAAASRSAPSVFLEYPIWMWHWALPDDPAVPWDTAPAGAADARVTWRRSPRRSSVFRASCSDGDGPPLLAPEVVARQMAVGEIVFV